MIIKTKSIGFDHFGDEEVFEERVVDLQLNSVNNILVKIEMAGVNPVDSMIREGRLSRTSTPNGFQVLGREAAGEVIKVYGNASQLKVGDKVIVRPTTGAYAEYITTNEQNLYKIPANMPMDFAAGFAGTATTAYWALFGNFYSLKKGETLAIIGASGAVGSFTLQLAKQLDVNIIAVASAKNKTTLEELGADIFIDYRDSEAIEKYRETADFVVDASLFNAGEKTALTLVKEKGTYLGMTTLPTDTLGKQVNILFLSRTAEMLEKTAIENILDFYEKYQLSQTVAYKLPMTVEGVKRAHELITSDRQSGKILLETVSEPEESQ